MTPPIPYRLACRILADCLAGQARSLAVKADPNRSAELRGVVAGDNAAAKVDGRLRVRSRLLDQVEVLNARVAWAYSHGDSLAPIERALGPLDGRSKLDYPEILRRLAESRPAAPPLRRAREERGMKPSSPGRPVSLPVADLPGWLDQLVRAVDRWQASTGSTRGDLARLAKMPEGRLSEILSGRRRNVPAEKVDRILRAMGRPGLVIPEE